MGKSSPWSGCSRFPLHYPSGPLPSAWMNEYLTTPQHKNNSAIACQTNGIYIKSNTKCLTTYN